METNRWMARIFLFGYKFPTHSGKTRMSSNTAMCRVFFGVAMHTHNIYENASFAHSIQSPHENVQFSCKNGFPDTDEPNETGKSVIFLALPLYIRVDSKAKTLNFVLLRTRWPCDFSCTPDTFVRNSIDSVTTIRARINCTQREKYSMCLKTEQRRISFAHRC